MVNSTAFALLSLWYFLTISDDLALLLCSFAIWRRNRQKHIRLFQLLVPMLIGVVLHSLSRELSTYAVSPDLRRAVVAATLSAPWALGISAVIRGLRSLLCWRFVLFSLGITNGVTSGKDRG
jgi:hypothetical protein